MNSFGDKLKITLFGESHGECIGIVIDGVPPGMPLSEEDLMPDVLRRKGGGRGTTTRVESDIPRIISGCHGGHATGAPITIIFKNENVRSSDYDSFIALPRPGHADFTSSVKYNYLNDTRGGGMFSGRMTLAIIAAGVVAKRILWGVNIKARLIEVGSKSVESEEWLSSKEAEIFFNEIEERGDSIGGVIECRVENPPLGLGNPFFDSVESLISHLVFSIPGIRGIEFGDGFQAARMKGSEHNDPFITSEGKTSKNGAGGINGGISNGNPIVFRVAVKPTSSIFRTQRTMNFITEEMEDLIIPGRHDICFALRVPVIIEAVTALALCQ